MSPLRSTLSHPATITIATLATATSTIVTAIFLRRYRHLLQKIAESESRIAKLEETRSAERKGRIRAEIKLRTLLKNKDASHDGSGNVEQIGESSIENEADTNRRAITAAVTQENEPRHDLFLKCIGTVVSPYTKRMGTPRQGALAPSGKGFVQLRIPVECVEGLEEYSHVWILFTFHANTDNPYGRHDSGLTSSKHGKINAGSFNLSKTKIRPPRGNGIKVGMLATRSPHRPNNVGLSLVKVIGVDKKEKRLHIASLDLVNGTPVYDVKPCVPWDIPGHHDNLTLKVPTWVSQDDALQTVEFTDLARQSLETHVRHGRLKPLYTSRNNGVNDASEAIREVLSQDPRASNTNGPNKRGSSSSDSAAAKNTKNTYKFVFCHVEVEFCIGTSGATVKNIVPLDLGGSECVDGIPVLLKNSSS